jgi:pimeloyl-ACP methyl ester carboxylesterase
MGMYDTPAHLEKILSINKHSSKVIYFGHSQGGASILAGMSEKLEYYKDKLKIVVLLAPASRVDNLDSKLLTFLKEIEIDVKLESISLHEVLPYDPELNALNIKFTQIYPTMHYAMLELTSDEISWMNCPDRIKVFFSHYPSGTSVKSLTHFKQLIESKNFQHFDYGEVENLKKYQSPQPKQYELTNIVDIPIIICAGLKDKLTHINDIRWLKSQISKTLYSYYEFEHMGHASFLINNDITWFNYALRDIYKILDEELNINNIVKNLERETSFKIGEKIFENGSYEGTLPAKR